MAENLNAPMPPSLYLAPTYTLRIAALDPTTGAAVAGVNIGTVVITGEGETSGLSLTAGNPILLGIGA